MKHKQHKLHIEQCHPEEPLDRCVHSWSSSVCPLLFPVLPYAASTPETYSISPHSRKKTFKYYNTECFLSFFFVLERIHFVWQLLAFKLYLRQLRYEIFQKCLKELILLLSDWKTSNKSEQEKNNKQNSVEHLLHLWHLLIYYTESCIC